MTCESCIILKQKVQKLTQMIEELREERDAANRKHSATVASLAMCLRDLAQLRQGLADLLV